MNLVRQRPWLVDVLLAGVLAVAALAQLWSGTDPELAGMRWRVLPLALLPPAALLLRRHRPLLVVAVVAGCLVVQAVAVAPSALLAQVACALVAVYSVAAHSRLAVSLLGFVVGCTGPVALALASDDSVAGTVSIAVFAGVPWVAGRTVRRVREYAVALERTTLALEEERERTARLAVVETRQHIARELHDVLAHGVGLMTVQAGGARRLVDRDPPRVRAALEVIEETGREALSELRLLLDGLDPHEEPQDPAPTLDGVLRRLEETAGTAHPVEVRVNGIPAPLSPGLDLVLCRIVQEAVANAVRHAPGARVAAEVEHTPHAVTLRVRNGPPAGEPEPAGARRGGGRGLMGMRERAALYGGRLSAGQTDDGGFLVEAQVPVRGAAS